MSDHRRIEYQDGSITFHGKGGGFITFRKEARPSVGWAKFRQPFPFEYELAVVGQNLSDNREALESRFSDEVLKTLESHALVALRMLEALRDNRPGYFEGLAKAMRKGPVGPTPNKKDEEHILWRAIGDAAMRYDRVPMQHEVGEAIERYRKGGVRADNLSRRLKAVGFDWLPKRAQGYQG